MKSNFAFGTKSRKALPFTVADLAFFSHPLTVNEDLIFSDLADRYDLDALSNADAADFMGEQTKAMAILLQSRVQGDPAPRLDAAWVAQNLGTDTFQTIMAFLRSGNRPEGEMNITDWNEEPLTVQDREFSSRRYNFTEQQQAARLDFQGNSRSITEGSLGFLANILSARKLDGEDVTYEWLRDNLVSEDVSNLLMYLQTGPEALENPNASEEAAAPEADAAAEESAISAA